MKLKLMLFLWLALSVSAFSQTKVQTIKGTVVDKQSQFPLIGANVEILGTSPLLGSTTDVDGIFRVDNIPIGRHTIQITYLGYEAVIIPNLILNSAKELDINISMEESLLTLDEVVITANTDKRKVISEMATVSARTLSIDEGSRYAGTFLDPSRMAQNFAGVSGASDDRNDIIIRGNSPLGVLWRMEGINIPSPNHFATLGSTGGPISLLNTNNLSSSDFFTGAWSADYGNALSGVFDLKLRNGNRDKREYVGQIGFNGFELGAEGPFKKGGKASYLINYRYSTLGVFKLLGLDFGTGSAVPEYQDLNFKINIPTKDKGIFTLWGMGGLSGIAFGDDEVSADSTNVYTDAEDFAFVSKTGIVGASHTYFYNNNTYSKASVVFSGVLSGGQTDTTNVDTGVKGKFFEFERYQYKISTHLKFNKKLNKQNTFAIGTIYDYYILDMQDSIQRGDQYLNIFDVDGGSSLLQTYLNWQYRQSSQLTFNLGLHQQYFSLSKSNAIEPRIGIRYDLSKKASFSFGFGMHSMIQPIVTYFIQNDDGEETNHDLDFTKAVHSVLGYDLMLGKNLRLKAEVYYQKLYNIPVDSFSSSYSFINVGADFSIPDHTGLINNGKGVNYGVELTLEKFFSKGYYFLLTTSLFDSKYTASNEEEYNTYFNSAYVVNALAGKEFKLGKTKSNSLSFDFKITYSGGRRYTPINLEASRLAGREVRFRDRAYESQYDPYFKIDFKISFKENKRRITQEWSVDLTNVTNHRNVFSRGYSDATGGIKTVFQRGLFPNVLYRIYF